MDALTKNIVSKERKVELALTNPYLVIRELNNRSLHHFTRWAWGILNPHKFVDNWHIRYLCQELEKVANRVGNREPLLHDLLINVPPGSTKTMLCTIIFPVWCWTKWYWMRIITASYASGLALTSAESARDLVNSDAFQKVYPELSIKQDKKSKEHYTIVKRVSNGSGLVFGHGKPKYNVGGYRFSTSVGGSLTGYHADIFIWDDPLNPKQAASEKELSIANTWIDETIPTRKTDKDISATIGIMQRLNQNDPTGHLIEKQRDNLKLICLPGEIFNGYDQAVKPAGLKKYYIDGLFDIRRLSRKTLKKLEKDLGPYGYAGQIGQSPAPIGGSLFKIANLGTTNELYAKKDIKRTVRYWDKAATKDGGAYTTGVKITLLKNKFFVIEDVKRGQWSTEVREKIIKQTARMDGDHVFVVVEQEPGSGGKESAEATIRNLAGFKVYKDRVTGDKTERAVPFSVQVNEGNVMMRVGSWNKAYIDELSLFPFSKFKDQGDASSGAFNFLTKKKQVKRIT